jgi:hypothetical protein
VDKKPSLEYTGQTTDEILACSETHDLVSLLFAFEWGLQAKARALGGEDKLNDEERLVLSVLALDREVNNGGFDQFFRNSSYRFTPRILSDLRRIGADKRAAITGRAIDALQLDQLKPSAIEAVVAIEDPARDEALSGCDDDFYALADDAENLFAFIVTNRQQIQVERTSDYPQLLRRKKLSKASEIRNSLSFWKRGWDPSVDEAKAVAMKIAQVRSITATEADFEAASVLFCFSRAIHFQDEKRATELSLRAFKLTRDDPMHQLEYKNWIELLLTKNLDPEADSAILDYLLFLKSGGRKDISEIGQRNSIIYWARLLNEYRTRVPRSVEFFESNFPEVKLEDVQPSRIIFGKPPTGKLSFKFLSELPEFSSE